MSEVPNENTTDITGVILAAGIGSRLKPITLNKPKCNAIIDNQSILDRQIEAFSSNGINEVTIIVGYLSEKVRENGNRISEEYDVDIKYVENKIYANTNNMYSLYEAEELLRGENIILCNGDVVVDECVINELTNKKGNYIACQLDSYSDEAMKVSVEGEYVRGLSKGFSKEESDGVSNDIYKLNSYATETLFDKIHYKIKNEQKYDLWTEVAIDQLMCSNKIKIEPHDIGDANWSEIDNVDDLIRADSQFGRIDLSKKSAVFFDLDGTVYVDNSIINGADEIINKLRDEGVDVYFLSNNSSGWKTEYRKKLEIMGIECTDNDIILSTDGVIRYLIKYKIDKTYVVGTDSMKNAIEDKGIDPESTNPECVIVGFDTELTYDKLKKATIHIRNGAEYLLAHQDKVCPTNEGFIPDCGSIGSLIESATGQSPDRIFGKPNKEMINYTINDNQYENGDIVIVGDRLETEMQLAANINAVAICVLSGDATRSDIENHHLEPKIARDIGSLNKWV